MRFIGPRFTCTILRQHAFSLQASFIGVLAKHKTVRKNLSTHMALKKLTLYLPHQSSAAYKIDCTTGKRVTETLKARNHTSPLFPSDDLPYVSLLCLRRNYSSVIDQNEGEQWLHVMSCAQERKEEKGGSRATMFRIWNHHNKVKVILYVLREDSWFLFLASVTKKDVNLPPSGGNKS